MKDDTRKIIEAAIALSKDHDVLLYERVHRMRGMLLAALEVEDKHA